MKIRNFLYVKSHAQIAADVSVCVCVCVRVRVRVET
jgi:hypothetical protein